MNVRNSRHSVTMCRMNLHSFSFSLLLELLSMDADSSPTMGWNVKKENKRKILGKFIIWFSAVSQLERLTCAFRHRRWWFDCKLWTICTPRPPHFAEVSSPAEWEGSRDTVVFQVLCRLCACVCLTCIFGQFSPCASVSCSYDSAFNYLSFGGLVHSIKISSFHFSVESTVEFPQKKII